MDHDYTRSDPTIKVHPCFGQSGGLEGAEWCVLRPYLPGKSLSAAGRRATIRARQDRGATGIGQRA